MRRTARYDALRPAVLGLCRILGTGLTAVAARPLSERESHGHEPDREGPSLVVLLVASMALVLLGGAFAGLTIAYVLSPLARLLGES